jgi:uncharacterized membrane protein
MESDWLRELAEHHRFKIIGGLAGFVLALMILRFGLLWTLFILLLTGVGYWIGKRLDEEPESIGSLIDRVIPPGRR